MKIAVLCQHDEPFRPVADITVPVMREWCDRHGYDFILNTDPPQRSIVWDRYRHLAETDGYDWLMHLDADVLLTNHHIRVEDLLPQAGWAVLCANEREDGGFYINDGVAVFSGDLSDRLILREVFKEQDPCYKCGQDVIQDAWLDEKTYWDYITLLPQKCLNSFLYEEYGMPTTTPGQWSQGDFALHLPGISNHRRVELLTERLPLILR